MKITGSLIDKLIRLRSGESVPASSLRGEWVEELVRDGVLVNSSHGSRRNLTASSPRKLERFLEYIDERLGHLDQMKNFLTEDASRYGQAGETGNSKLVMARSCPGFPVNSYEPIGCLLKGAEINVCPQEGTFLFVADWKEFAVPEDVVIVGVENMENFRLVGQQRSLFESLLPGKRLLFVSRYPQSADLRLWLQSIPNSYVHFGDFDLAGINIFLTEFWQYLGERASFLIPEDIEERLQKGSTERYQYQYRRFGKLSTNIPQVQKLISLIHMWHRCYDQEGYIAK